MNSDLNRIKLKSFTLSPSQFLCQDIPFRNIHVFVLTGGFPVIETGIRQTQKIVCHSHFLPNLYIVGAINFYDMKFCLIPS